MTTPLSAFVAMPASQAAVFDGLCERLEMLERRVRFDEHSREIWDVADVASYLKCTPEHARRWVMADPRFPKPIDLFSRTNGGKGNSRNRYVAGEVIAYCLRHRKR